MVGPILELASERKVPVLEHAGLNLLAEQSGAQHLIFGTHVPFSYPGSALVKRAVLPLDKDALAEMSSGNAVRTLGLPS